MQRGFTWDIVRWKNKENSDEFVVCNGQRLDLMRVSNATSFNIVNTYLDNQSGKNTNINVNVISSRKITSPDNCINCVEWGPKGNSTENMLLHGSISGNVQLLDWNKDDVDTVYAPIKGINRVCTEVAWNSTSINLVAASFAKVKNEVCAFVWDLERNRQQPIYRASQDPSSSISWLPMEKQLLVVGTFTGYIRLFELGTGKKNDIASIMAYKKTGSKSRGITVRTSPHDTHILATFTTTPGDAVKIWDLRKPDTSVSSYKLNQSAAILPSMTDQQPTNDTTTTTTFTTNATMVDVQWSPHRHGVLAVALSDSADVHVYDYMRDSMFTADRDGSNSSSAIGVGVDDRDTWSHETVTHPIFRINSGLKREKGGEKGDREVTNSGLHEQEDGSIRALSWQPYIDDRSRPRLLMTTSKHVVDTHLVESVPLAIGATSEQHVAFGIQNLCVAPLRSLLSIDHPNVDSNINANVGNEGKCYTDMNGNIITQSIGSPVQSIVMTKNYMDMDTILRWRATQGYSLDADKNVKVLNRELGYLAGQRPSLVRKESQARVAVLMTVWDWVARVEALTAESQCKFPSNSLDSSGADETDKTDHAETSHLQSCGILNLIEISPPTVNIIPNAVNAGTTSRLHLGLVLSVYESERRSIARLVCGWAERLKDITAQDFNNSDDEEEEEISDVEDDIKDEGDVLESVVGTGIDGDDDAIDFVAEDEDVDTNPTGNTGRIFNRIDSLDTNLNDSQYDKGRGHPSASKKATGIGTSHREQRLWRRVGDHGPIADIVDSVEVMNSFERAAALALFHGDASLAVRVLQRNVNELRSARTSNASLESLQSDHENGNYNGSSSSDHKDDPYDDGMDESYLQKVSLVTMAVAGFLNLVVRMNDQVTSTGTSLEDLSLSFQRKPKSSRLSQDTCTSVCGDALHALKNCIRPAAAYLRAMCRFILCCIGSERHIKSSSIKKVSYLPPVFVPVLADTQLSVEDRVAFACTFLNDADLLVFVKGLMKQCTLDGDIGGLVITGLGVDGCSLLQRYIDRYDDLQTVALLVSRLPKAHSRTSTAPAFASIANSKNKSKSHQESKESDEIENDKADTNADLQWQWLYDYRQLLNRWCLFMERASLDVELGKRWRVISKGGMKSEKQKEANKTKAPSRSSGIGRGPGSSYGMTQKNRRVPEDRTLWTLPPHSPGPYIFLRCHYCSASLPVDSMDKQNHATWLRRQRPILNCCPSCKKQLPRCYVCYLYMGMLNPQAEFNCMSLAQRRRTTAPKSSSSTTKTTTDTTIANTTTTTTTTIGSSVSGSTASAKGDVDKSLNVEDKESKNPQIVLNFGKWFTWCQHCRHGGHAGCLGDWFETHSTCGVNGCDCNCKLMQ